MEILDTYDEYMNYIKPEDIDTVHSLGLWHKTVHCWLYDKLGNIYFQIRKSSQKLYTTASGHVQSGETIKQAFAREVKEELGVSVSLEDASLVEINAWRMDKIKNGKPFIDRAFAHVYLNKIDTDKETFNIGLDEVSGVIKVNAKECLKLLNYEIASINAIKITDKCENVNISINDFLVQNNELAIIKYGKIIQNVINQTI